MKQRENKTRYAVLGMLSFSPKSGYEIVSLEKREIDSKRHAIILEDTKNGEQRVLFLGAFAWSLFSEHLKHVNKSSSLVFPSPNNENRPLDIQTAWETALARAKVKDFCFHDLRHSAASYLAMNGASLAEISEILGHKTLSIVKRYAHISESHTAKVVESMNQKIFGNSPKRNA